MPRARLTQIDGALPNLALMKLAAWLRARGWEIVVTREIEPDLFEDARYDAVYGSCIFSFSQLRLMRFMRQWPGAVVGGTGTPFTRTVEQVIGVMMPVASFLSCAGVPGQSSASDGVQAGAVAVLSAVGDHGSLS
jgi:hypothetical protein